jgi:hypothetical protein
VKGFIKNKDDGNNSSISSNNSGSDLGEVLVVLEVACFIRMVLAKSSVSSGISEWVMI